MPATLPAAPASRHHRSDSRSGAPVSNTFAPSFIKSDSIRTNGDNVDAVDGIEGENDFSGKRYVWLRDPKTAFVKGWIVEELEGDQILVQCDDGSVCLTTLITRPICSGTPGKLTLPTATRSRCRERR
ncbi:hypothetical protein IMZ48_13535 [Candidatus Bathyarchaeota archaeon]|nr:hypothetical protein [Candidatus Bathyarchaeota archaeon]